MSVSFSLDVRLICILKMRYFKLVPSFIIVIFVSHALADPPNEFVIRMPSVHPSKADVYLHTTKQLSDSDGAYIVAFEPLASMEIVHHMMIYGCENVKMLESGLGGCAAGNKELFYVWGRNAPSLYLPKGVGFKVGKSVGIQYIMLEVHYANVSTLQEGPGDASGVILYLTSESLSKRAGVFLLSTGGYIMGGTTEHFEVACRVKENIDMHPFAFRTHAHERGLLIAGYRVRNTESGGLQQWDLIGKKNPLLPQYFYPVVDNTMIIKQGDIVAARCTMQNNETRTIYIGATHKDEMCNFYVMYYVEGQELSMKSCYSMGPPNYYWELDDSLSNIPKDASTP